MATTKAAGSRTKKAAKKSTTRAPATKRATAAKKATKKAVKKAVTKASTKSAVKKAAPKRPTSTAGVRKTAKTAATKKAVSTRKVATKKAATKKAPKVATKKVLTKKTAATKKPVATKKAAPQKKTATNSTVASKAAPVKAAAKKPAIPRNPAARGTVARASATETARPTSLGSSRTGAPQRKTATGDGGTRKPRKITPEQALANTRALLNAKHEQDRQPQPWQALDPEQSHVAETGFQSQSAMETAEELHAGESRQAAIQGSISTRDRHQQGKRDNR